MLLRVMDIHTFYGWSHILFGLTLQVSSGEIVSLLGRNGAGKTTAFRSIIGLTAPKSGEIYFKEEQISGLRPYVIARKGVGYVPSGGRLFGGLSVEENLIVTAMRQEQNATKGIWTLEKIYAIFPRLEARRTQKANSLSGGERQMVTIGRTLMCNPELLILDEPSTGLSPLVLQAVGENINSLRDRGLSILLAEQNATFALNLCERCYIIDKGSICFTGSPLELKQNEELMRTYLAV